MTQDEEILSVTKGYVIPFLKVPVQRTVPKKGDNVQNTGIVNRSGDYGNAGQSSDKTSGISIPRQISEEYSAGKKKDGGNRPCINLKTLNKFIPYKHFRMEGLH